jgi:shikimate kinase
VPEPVPGGEEGTAGRGPLPPPPLLPPPPPPAVFLVGYRASGKTAVGEALARRLGAPFIDTDDLVASRAGKSIAALFAEEGEAAFRARESQVLGTLVERIRAGERPVVATGGGMVLSSHNVALMRSSGFVVWLEASVETLSGRIASDSSTGRGRPALLGASSIDEVGDVLRRREPLYRGASHERVSTERVSVEQAAAEVMRALAGATGREAGAP